LRRAEEARPRWFPDYRIPDCVIEEINPIEVNAPLAYYRPPAGGTRPGAHCVLTAQPEKRFTYEYEALAFHESVPGHHLQIASAQTLAGLPEYRRYLDAEVGAYVEGRGLYCERLADEMGLYTSDVARLGMLSFDALRACRLVVDTGMHHFGWSRSRAADFMWERRATTKENVDNEIDRYIGWPGRALGYMIGRREIVRLREEAQRRRQAQGRNLPARGTQLVLPAQLADLRRQARAAEPDLPHAGHGRPPGLGDACLLRADHRLADPRLETRHLREVRALTAERGIRPVPEDRAGLPDAGAARTDHRRVRDPAAAGFSSVFQHAALPVRNNLHNASEQPKRLLTELSSIQHTAC
jgi:hypothetical protein